MEHIGLLVLRVLTGLMMIMGHGWSKMVNFETMAVTFPNITGLGSGISLGLAIFGEVICQIMIILGIKTRWFSIPAFITMMVALILVHGGDPWMKQEKAAMYAMVYLVLIITNGGRHSIKR